MQRMKSIYVLVLLAAAISVIWIPLRRSKLGVQLYAMVSRGSAGMIKEVLLCTVLLCVWAFCSVICTLFALRETDLVESELNTIGTT